MDLPYPTENCPTIAPLESSLQTTSEPVKVAALLEYLLKQPKYRCFFGRTNTVAEVLVSLWVVGSIISFNPIGCVVFWLAHKGLKSDGESGSLRPVIIHTIVLLVILGILTIIGPPLFNVHVPAKIKDDAAASAVYRFIFLSIMFFVLLWNLFVFRRAQEFLEEAKEIRVQQGVNIAFAS